MTALVLTGERTLPGIDHENYWFRRHEAAYRYALPFVVGARVLEAGAGEGYGADLLAERAGRVIAIDSDAAAVAHAARRYPRVQVLRGDLQRLPLAAGAVEAVVSLQVIEHLADQPAFLAECARALVGAGTLIVSTPNRLTFSPGRTEPQNPFHTRELTAAELVGLIDAHARLTRVLGVHHGPRLRRWEARHGSVVDAQLARPAPEWDPGLRRLVAGVRAEDFVLRADAVDASLDLLVVGWRRP